VEEAREEEIKKEMLKSIRQMKNELKNMEGGDKEAQEEGIMLCEMNEIVLANEEEETSVSSVHGSMVEVPPDREDEIEDTNEENKAEALPQVDLDNDKVKLMSRYLKQNLGKKVLYQAKAIIESFVTSEEDFDFDLLFPRLGHIMNRDVQTEFVPIIYSLIELERSRRGGRG
jgi:hypothetical protein